MTETWTYLYIYIWECPNGINKSQHSLSNKDLFQTIKLNKYLNPFHQVISQRHIKSLFYSLSKNVGYLVKGINLAQNNSLVLTNVFLEKPMLGMDVLGPTCISSSLPTLLPRCCLQTLYFWSVFFWISIPRVETIFLTSFCNQSNPCILRFIVTITVSVINQTVSFYNLDCHTIGYFSIKTTNSVLDLKTDWVLAVLNVP